MTRPHRRPSLMPRMSENWPRDRWFWSDAEGPIRPRCRSAFPTSDGDLRGRSEPLSSYPTNRSGSRDQPSTVEIHRARVMETGARSPVGVLCGLASPAGLQPRSIPQEDYRIGCNSPSIVGMSSETVGWTGMARCNTGYGATAVALAERPDARHVGRQEIINLDVTARIDRDAGLIEAEIVGIRATPDGEQHIGADDLRIALDAVDPDGNAFCMRRQPDTFGAGAHGDAFALKDLADRLRDVLILAADETRCHFDDRHPGAEPPVYLREFEADIAAADDD